MAYNGFWNDESCAYFKQIVLIRERHQLSEPCKNISSLNNIQHFIEQDMLYKK